MILFAWLNLIRIDFRIWILIWLNLIRIEFDSKSKFHIDFWIWIWLNLTRTELWFWIWIWLNLIRIGFWMCEFWIWIWLDSIELGFDVELWFDWTELELHVEFESGFGFDRIQSNWMLTLMIVNRSSWQFDSSIEHSDVKPRRGPN